VIGRDVEDKEVTAAAAPSESDKGDELVVQTTVTEISESPFKVGRKARLTHGNVNYLLEGPAAPAPLVVLLHGFNSSLAAFETLLPHFWQQGFRTLVYDHYGHGLSSLPCCSQLNHITLATQLEELLNAVAPDASKVGLIGFSMGGVVASEFARSRPGRVSRLCLLAPAGLLDKAQTPHGCFLFNCLRGPAGGCVVSLVTCLAGLATHCCCAKSKLMKSKSTLESVSPDVGRPDKFADVTQRNLHRLAHNPTRAATTYFRILRQMPMWGDEFGIYESLAKGQIPVLFIWGEEDGTIPLDEVGADLSRMFAPTGASCLIFKRTGHHSFVEFP
jgi:pimeloyl-ACP methyl ester carboxylesterase